MSSYVVKNSVALVDVSAPLTATTKTTSNLLAQQAPLCHQRAIISSLFCDKSHPHLVDIITSKTLSTRKNQNLPPRVRITRTPAFSSHLRTGFSSWSTGFPLNGQALLGSVWEPAITTISSCSCPGIGSPAWWTFWCKIRNRANRHQENFLHKERCSKRLELET
jgi:hypothetical protein